MEQGKKRVKVLEYYWGWRYVGERLTLKYIIVGVKSFIMDGKTYEPYPPPPIGLWNASCDKVSDDELPEYVCNEGFINRLIACSK